MACVWKSDDDSGGVSFILPQCEELGFELREQLPEAAASYSLSFSPVQEEGNGSWFHSS